MMNVRRFSMDESGYTGFDLLNHDQRLQGATAVSISEDEARHLIRFHFPRLHSAEIKYRSISRRPKHYDAAIDFLASVTRHFDNVTYICDKRFLLILMFCDSAIEPWYYARGVNFFADGQNYALASLLAVAGPQLLGRKPFEEMLYAFQYAMKSKSKDSIERLIKAAKQTNWTNLPEAIGPLAQFECPECILEIVDPSSNTDAAFIVVLSLISRLEKMSTIQYVIDHDESKNLMTYHNVISKFINNTDRASFKITEITEFTFPLKLSGVYQIDSKKSHSIQVADIVIGLAIDACSIMLEYKSKGPNAEKVMELFEDHQFIHLFPDTDFENQKIFRSMSQSNELINYLSERFFKS